MPASQQNSPLYMEEFEIGYYRVAIDLIAQLSRKLKERKLLLDIRLPYVIADSASTQELKDDSKQVENERIHC